MIPPPKPTTPERLARQRRRVRLLGILLIVTGLAVMVALPKLPTPLRLMSGVGDVFIGLVLLVVARQAPR